MDDKLATQKVEKLLGIYKKNRVHYRDGSRGLTLCGDVLGKKDGTYKNHTRNTSLVTCKNCIRSGWSQGHRMSLGYTEVGSNKIKVRGIDG